MKIRSIVLTDLILKFISVATILLVYGLKFDVPAVASSLKSPKNNSYSLEEASYFSLKLNRNVYNQLEKEILKQQADFSEYINLINNGLNKNKYRSQLEDNILIQSPTKREQKLLEYFVDSLRKLELESLSNNDFNQVSIPILSQVNYSDVYKEVYDFDISLADNSQIQSPTRRVPINSIKTQPLQDNQYLTSYFRGNTNSNYSSFQSKSVNPNNPNSSLLVSSQQSFNSNSSRNSSLIGLPLATNQRKFSFLQNSIADINNQNYLEQNNTTSQLRNEGQVSYINSNQIQAYQLNNFNVPSISNTYQKSEHQEELDKILQKQRQQLKKEREKMAKNLAKLRKEREKAREKEQEKYRKQRQKNLVKAMKQQQKLQKQRQQQFRQ